MKYFTYFPKILVDGKTITNIAAKCEMLKELKDKETAFEFYNIVDGETAEVLAAQFYGDPQYDWIIWLANDIAMPFEQWPLFEDEINALVVEKYGFTGQYDVHHYETNATSPLGEGVWVDPGYEPTSEIREVLNGEYERELNDAKRRIKIIRPELVPFIENDLREQMRQLQEEDVPQ